MGQKPLRAKVAEAASEKFQVAWRAMLNKLEQLAKSE